MIIHTFHTPTSPTALTLDPNTTHTVADEIDLDDLAAFFERTYNISINDIVTYNPKANSTVTQGDAGYFTCVGRVDDMGVEYTTYFCAIDPWLRSKIGEISLLHADASPVTRKRENIMLAIATSVLDDNPALCVMVERIMRHAQHISGSWGYATFDEERHTHTPADDNAPFYNAYIDITPHTLNTANTTRYDRSQMYLALITTAFDITRGHIDTGKNTPYGIFEVLFGTYRGLERVITKADNTLLDYTMLRLTGEI